MLLFFQLAVQGKFGMEPVLVCQSTFASHPSNRDAFTWSEYEWLMVEVNTLWRRARSDVSDADKRVKIPFFVNFATRTSWTRRTLDGIDKQMFVQHMTRPGMAP